MSQRRWIGLFVVLLIPAVMGCEELLAEDIEISSDIDSDETWSSANNYIVSGTVDVEAELVIEPGSQIEFEEGARLQVVSGGALIADGTEADPILFTGTQETPGWWDGLVFRSSDHPNNLVNHVIVEYAGADSPRGTREANLVVGRDFREADTPIRNTELRHGAGYGLYLHSGSDLTEFSNNRITNNEGAAVRAGADRAHLFGSDSSYSGNDHDAVRIFDRTVDDMDVTWQNLDVPYHLSGQTSVEGVLLTIEAGTELQFDTDGRLQVTDQGALDAQGTDEAPILFTGTEKTPGWWDGIFFRDSDRPDTMLDHIIVEYGGGDSQRGTEEANIIIGRDFRDAEVPITNSELRHSDGYGLYIHSASDLREFSNNTLTDNADAAVRAGADRAHHFDAASSYTGNGDDVIRIYSRTVDDEDVTWNNLEVPYHFSGETSVEDIVVTIEAGAQLQFDAGARLQVTSQGALDAQGSDNEPILFTGTQQTEGWWEGIFFRDSDRIENTISQAIVEYGGGDSQRGTEEANIIVGRDFREASVSVTDSELRNSDGYGIFLHESSELNTDVCTVNEFSNNTSGDCGGSI